MLTALSIADVLLIDRLDLEFGRGLTVLTGETGAGKSILLDSLGLALGARADSTLVRAGADKARVTASFATGASTRLSALLKDNDVPDEGGELMLRRSVTSDGRSRAWINGEAVSVGLLREVGSLLVEIHGQHDERGLLDRRGHRALLDLFARNDAERAAVADAYRSMREAERALEEARAALEKASAERDYLEHSASEIATFAPQEGEEAELAEERAAMMAGQRIADDLSAVGSELQDADGALARLRAAARRLDRIAEAHPTLGEALAAVDRALLEADEAEAKLSEANEALTFDPARVEAVEERLFALRALARKHRVEPDALPALAETLREKLGAIERSNAEMGDLDAAVKRTQATFDTAARSLTQARKAAADALGKAVMAELAPLKLEAARFRAVVEAAEESAEGRDSVSFEISTNPGADFGPLIRIASGGELSRFILALKVALSAEGEANTLVFDEIDRGVGGATAGAIGDRLARLADPDHGDAQVLVVTHSPQVAARGAAHFRIFKRSEDEATTTTVERLTADQRREEIARMLSGASITDEARAQAERLMA